MIISVFFLTWEILVEAIAIGILVYKKCHRENKSTRLIIKNFWNWKNVKIRPSFSSKMILRVKKKVWEKIDQIKNCECWKDEFIKVDNTYFFECQLREFFSRSSYLSKAISSNWVLLCFYCCIFTTRLTLKTRIPVFNSRTPNSTGTSFIYDNYLWASYAG